MTLLGANRWLGDMSPYAPVHNGPYGRLRQSKFFGYVALCSRIGGAGSDGYDDSRSDFGQRVVFAGREWARLVAFLDRIADVVGNGSDEQMRRIDAAPVVAGVADIGLKAIRNFGLVCQHPRNTMGTDVPSLSPSETKEPVAVGCQSAVPQPALFWRPARVLGVEAGAVLFADVRRLHGCQFYHGRLREYAVL